MLSMIYRIVTGLVRIPLNQYLVPANINNRILHSLAYYIAYSTQLPFVFFPSTFLPWNSAPQHGVSVNSLDALTSNIQTLCYHRYYMQTNCNVYKYIILCCMKMFKKKIAKYMKRAGYT